MLRRHLMFSGEFFSPFSVGNPALWLSSRYPSSLWKERTTPTSPAILNGDVVGTWMDLSGNARNVAAPSDAARPTLATGSLGSWPVVLFDGANDKLSIIADVLRNLENITVFLVANRTAGYPGINQYGAASAGGLCLFYNDAATVGFEGRPLISGSYGTYKSSRKTGVTASSYAVLSGSYSNSVGLSHWYNGSAATPDSFTSTNSGGPTTFSLGGVDASTYGAGGIAEVIVYHFIMTNSQRQYIERGLGRAYGITVA